MDMQQHSMRLGSLLLIAPVVALLHALALLWLLAGIRAHLPATNSTSAQGVLILLPPRPSRPAHPLAQTAKPLTLPRPAVAMTRPALAEPPAPLGATPPTATREDTATVPPLLASAQATSAPASAPPRPSLLDNDATRRAVRMATREPLLSERAAAASEDPGRLSAQQRMGQDIAQAANGDCLKGEYAGGGMGLLSLPFWLAAEVRGKCRR
jgi:hypothetical protein